MKLNRFHIFLVIIIASVSLKLPAIVPIELPINVMEADTQVQNAEEFETVLKRAISEVKESTKIRIARYDEKTYDVNTIFKRIMEENVQLGFVTGFNTIVTRTFIQDSAVMELELLYSYPVEKVAEMRGSADNKANEIIRSILKPGMSEYGKVLAVHDYVIKNSVYDSANADNGTVPAEEHEAYGVLIKGIGVCDSYTKAVKLLLDKMGIECILVEGNKLEGTVQNSGDTDHAWNIVRLDGEYYHIDATWDDAAEDKDSDVLVYHYFNVNDAEMQKTHIWDRSKYPACTATAYNYYRYNKLIANNSAETLSRLVKAFSVRQKKLVIKISDYKSSTYNIEELIKRAAEKSKLKSGISANWIVEESLGIVDFEFKY